ncbi:glycosyltransferase family 4 protein [Pseudolysinimonas sp.]|jgi:glycosyltransferase involved in cell wall biosynthesis|uniref:glycosyltransferase family 4 protein n=1 Tax=Pseudolysinimonas sp. TaxID=2680009 RepID=UPI003783ADE7
MSTLRVVVDQIVAPVPGGIGRYTEELARALIATAPAGAHVEGFASAITDDEHAHIRALLPGLGTLHKSALARRELSLAWQHGFTPIPGSGMLHATSLLAPLRRHDRHRDLDSQVVVTIHDAVPWTHPETLTPRGVSWHKAMARRAERYADAVVVPTHSVAADLSELLDLGNRIRVIGGAPSSALRLPDDADARARRLELPERYIFAAGTLEPRKGLASLIRAMGDIPGDVPLLIAGPPGWGGVDVAAISADVGIAEGRVRVVGRVDDPDLAVLFSRASAFVMPSLAEGFGLPVIEAFSLGTPVVHSDVPALSEVAGGAGLEVTRGDGDGYPGRLADAIQGVLDDHALADRLAVSGKDRSKAFTWRDSAEKVWQLHADL